MCTKVVDTETNRRPYQYTHLKQTILIFLRKANTINERGEICDQSAATLPGSDWGALQLFLAALRCSFRKIKPGSCNKNVWSEGYKYKRLMGVNGIRWNLKLNPFSY